MWGPRCGRLLHFCKHQVAPSTAPAPGGEKSVPAKRARDFFRAARSVTAFPLSSLRPKVLPALLLPVRRMRRVFFATLILPARRERFPFARVFRDSLANPRERFRGAEDFLSEISRAFPQFSCAFLQTILRRPKPAVLPIRF